MLWFLARTGSPPTVIVGGPRSLLAFWLGGAASTASVTPPQTGGSGSDLVYPFKGTAKRHLQGHADEITSQVELDQAISAKQIAETAIAAALRSAADTRALKAKAIELQDDLNLRLLLLMSE